MSDVQPCVSENNKTPAPPGRALRRWVIRSIGMLVLTGFATGLWLVYQVASDSLHAENGLHATRWTIEATEDYLKAHDGAWPRSWEDLEQSSNSMKDAYRTTGGREHVQEFVFVDFQADPDRLSKQTPEEFEAIKPVGPYFDLHREEIQFLLDTLRQTRPAKRAK